MKKIAFIFPGQGAQYIGMCKKLYEEYDIVRKTFDEANEILGFDLKELCFNGNISELTKTENTQPSVLVASVAMYRLFRELYSIEPYCLLGHSLGEISALTCSGAINFKDAIKIVKKRGELMQKAGNYQKGVMAAISGVGIKTIKKTLDFISQDKKMIGIGCYNSHNQIIISGEENLVNNAINILKSKNAEVNMLNVSGAFHSNLMQSAADEFKKELSKYSYNDCKWKVISNLDIKPYMNTNEIIDKLNKQLIKPVLWNDAVNYLEDNEVDLCIEFGPKSTLKKLIQNNSHIEVLSFDLARDINILSKELSDFKNIESNSKKNDFNFIRKCLSMAICTENRESKNGYENVLKDIQKIKNIYENTEKEQNSVSLDDMLKALEIVLSIFYGKKVHTREQYDRLKELAKATSNKRVLEEVQAKIRKLNNLDY